MGSIAHPEDSEAWEQVTLGPAKLPGVWTVEGDATLDLEVKKMRGKDGARFRDNGYNPAKLTLVGRMVERAEWNAMQAALKQIHPRLGKPRNPLTLEHPAAAYLGVTTVYVEGVQTPRMENGIIVVEIHVVEWLEAPKVAKPKRMPLSPDGGLRRLPNGTFDASPDAEVDVITRQSQRRLLSYYGGPSREPPTYILGKP